MLINLDHVRGAEEFLRRRGYSQDEIETHPTITEMLNEAYKTEEGRYETSKEEK